MKFRNICAASALALALTACGGGGSGSSSSGGSPAPTPTPTPTPSPTPSPTPTPSYSTFSELTGDQTFDMTCGALNGNLAGITRVTTPFGDELSLASNRDEPNYTITSLGNRVPAGSISFDQTDRDLNQTGFEGYQRNSPSGSPQFLIIDTPLLDNQPTLYTRYLQSTFRVTPDDNLRIRCGFGVPTLLEDVPAEAASKSIADFFALTLETRTSGSQSEQVAYDLDVSVVAFNFDPNSGSVTVELTLRGQEIFDDGSLSTVITELGDFTASGSFDGETTNFGGAITIADGTEVGDFAGWFFGPQGAEVAIAYNITQGSTSDFESRGALFLR